jgi:hypothetical protein
MRRRSNRLHRRQRGRGEQNYSKVCHVVSIPGKFPGSRFDIQRQAINK